MNRLAVWSIAGALVIGATGLMVVNAQQRQGAAFIAGDAPVTEDQVRAKLQTDGWSNVQIVRDGRYFDIKASKDGQAGQIVVDGQTGRLRADNEDDDDDD
jgi:hypothetical protein